jgi:hypothetical protein
VHGEAALEQRLFLPTGELRQEQEAKNRKNTHGKSSNVREPSREDCANVLSIARNKFSKLTIIRD